jgi:hypothetical protein
MLETFESPKMLAHLRAGPSGPYMDGLAAWLERSGYDPSVAVRYLRSAAHIGHFILDQGGTLADMDLAAFSRHLRTCRCPRSKGGRRNHHTVHGARRYREYLVAIGVGQCGSTPESQNADPAIIVEYRRWLRKHRGAAESTVRLYSRDAADLLTALGHDPGQWDAKAVRDHFLDRASKCGAGTAEKRTTGLRGFLRYLSACGICRGQRSAALQARHSLQEPHHLFGAQYHRQLLRLASPGVPPLAPFRSRSVATCDPGLERGVNARAMLRHSGRFRRSHFRPIKIRDPTKIGVIATAQ